jgi:hypothetical protein
MDHDHFLLSIFAVYFNMPCTSRVVCAGFNKPINESAFNECSNSLFRLILPARASKRKEIFDQACQKCRYKFDNWVTKTNGDLDKILVQSLADHNEVDVYCVDPIFERIVLNSVCRSARQECSN